MGTIVEVEIFAPYYLEHDELLSSVKTDGLGGNMSEDVKALHLNDLQEKYVDQLTAAEQEMER